MKFFRIACFAVIALCLAGSSFAGSAPCEAPLVTADSGLPGVLPGLEAPAPPADLAPVEGPEVTDTACSATAYCHTGSTISCSTGGSGSCVGINSSCPNQRGYVRCGTQYTYCPSCPVQEFCSQGAACGIPAGPCGYSGSERGVCYQGQCRCWCAEGQSCSTNSDCGPSNTPGVCSSGVCVCL